MENELHDRERAEKQLAVINSISHILDNIPDWIPAAVPVPLANGAIWSIATPDQLVDCKNGTVLATPDGLYVKHWHHWNHAYGKVTHADMWIKLLEWHVEGPLDGRVLLTTVAVLEP